MLVYMASIRLRSDMTFLVAPSNDRYLVSVFFIFPFDFKSLFLKAFDLPAWPRPIYSLPLNGAIRLRIIEPCCRMRGQIIPLFIGVTI